MRSLVVDSRLALLAALFVGFNAYGSDFGTAPSWDGSSHITALDASASTYGQTFAVESSALLDSWTFYMRDSSLPGYQNLVFDALLTQWSEDRAVGPVLFEARGLSLPDSDRGQFYELKLNIGGVELLSKQRYVMFLNTSNYDTTFGQKADLGATPDLYSNGEFWYQLSYNRKENVFEYPWSCGDEGGGCRYGDSAFLAVTTPVPEPTTVVLLSIGLALLLRPNPSLKRSTNGRPRYSRLLFLPPRGLPSAPA